MTATITERLPKAKQLFDRFHLAKLASEALDEVRRAELRNTNRRLTSMPFLCCGHSQGRR